MKQIHNGGDNAFRMPLFLPKELEMKWLQPDLSDADLKNIMDYQMPSEELKYHSVNTIRTTKERADGKTKIHEFQWANLPPLGQDTIENSLF
jgi:putative SOS response-associated peptidase YedK